MNGQNATNVRSIVEQFPLYRFLRKVEIDELFVFDSIASRFPHISLNIVLGTAEYDFCKGANYQMSEILNNKGIRHWLDVRPHGTHDWPVWREMFPHYLSVM